MSFEDDAKAEPLLHRQNAMSPDEIEAWNAEQVGNEPSEEMGEMDLVEDNSDSGELPEEVEDDEEDGEELPLDLGWYFDQFDLDAKARIRLCSTYASVLRAQIAFQTSPKKRKIIDLTKD